MTPEQRAKEDAWLRKHLADDEPGGLMAISPRMLDLMFPHTDATGMSPEQAAAAMADRDSKVREFLAAAGGPAARRTPIQNGAVTASPEVPAS